MEKSEELFKEAFLAEECLHALIGGYYDTHDLHEIEENKEDYEYRLKELKLLFNIPEDDCVFEYEFDEKTNNITKKNYQS
jgi:hypothetical protein